MESREVGSPICCSPKRCVLGKKSIGTHNRVLIDLKCPPGTKVVGTHHSHPEGQSELSTPDIVNLRKAGLSIGCVTGKQGLKCYKIRGNHK